MHIYLYAPSTYTLISQPDHYKYDHPNEPARLSLKVIFKMQDLTDMESTFALVELPCCDVIY